MTSTANKEPTLADVIEKLDKLSTDVDKLSTDIEKFNDRSRNEERATSVGSATCFYSNCQCYYYNNYQFGSAPVIIGSDRAFG